MEASLHELRSWSGIYAKGVMWGQADIDSLDTFSGLTSLMGSMHFQESNGTLNKR